MTPAARLVAAMHLQGCKPRGASEWLTLAQTHDALAQAFRPVFGNMLPHRTALGQWLKEHSGKSFGELRLVAMYSEHAKAHRYAVETQWETTARECAEDERETRRDIIEAEKEQRAITRELKRQAKVEAEKQPEPTGPTLIVTQLPPPEPAPDYEYDQKLTSDGRVVRSIVMDPRTGEPMKKRLEAPAAPPPKPVELERPLTRVEQMRARYIEHHQGNVPGEHATHATFSDPGGVVSANRAREHRGTDFLWWSKNL